MDATESSDTAVKYRKHKRIRSEDLNLLDPKSEFPVGFSHKRSASQHVHRESWSSSVTKAVAKAEGIVIDIITQGWNVVHHSHLPEWLRDNDYLVFGHRPQLPSFNACFQSIFRIHTETGNIWTHLLGFIAFLVLSVWFLVQPSLDLDWQERFVVSVFFASALMALGFSWLFHTVYCHSQCVASFFNKLDYAGITILTIGSFVPWLHFSFYCYPTYKLIYLTCVLVLGGICIIVSMQDSFQTPAYRRMRAGLFVCLGSTGVFPCVHYMIIEGVWRSTSRLAIGYLVLMAVLYITGATIYAMRFPECWRPGKFDLWLQSHQIFHVFVVAAALVHFKGILTIAEFRLANKSCEA